MSAREEQEREEPKVLALTQPGLKLLFDYWNALRNGRLSPRRSEVDPGALRTLLSHVFILQRHDCDHVVFRVAGTALCAAFGRELCQHNFIGLWARNDKPVIRALLVRLAEKGHVGLIRAAGVTFEKRTVAIESMLLPLADDCGAPSRILGMASFADPTGALGWRKLVHFEAFALAVVDPDRDRVVLDSGAQRSSPFFALRPALVLPGASGASPRAPTLTHPWSDALRDRLKLDT